LFLKASYGIIIIHCLCIK